VLDGLIRQHGADGAENFRRFKPIGDMLGFADNVLVPRDRPTLSRDGFVMVRDLIDRALA